MRDEVEPVQSERIGQPADALDLGVISGRCRRWFGAAEAGPVGGDDAMMLGQGGDLVSPAGRALRIAVQQQHRLALTGLDVYDIHFVQTSIKFGCVTRRRGRPRAYDPAVAMRQARDTFWRGGYAATSLEDLSAGMGMNRPSIYAAFGDKRALYLQAVTEYAETSRAWLATALARPRPLPDGLRAVYRYAGLLPGRRRRATGLLPARHRRHRGRP